ncbi:hypothetical protein [Massilia sp. HP4]|uniref:hypothetical protein n=1 Tax=Massilia sp. HP4 TaxID=2562316 RepID=UPI00148587C2|nr:hypothetical protein [Massilia sp. HP4]
MDIQKTSLLVDGQDKRQQSAGPVLVVVRSLLSSLIVLALPQGAGVLLIALASSLQGTLRAQRMTALRGVAASMKAMSPRGEKTRRSSSAVSAAA